MKHYSIVMLLFVSCACGKEVRGGLSEDSPSLPWEQVPEQEQEPVPAKRPTTAEPYPTYQQNQEHYQYCTCYVWPKTWRDGFCLFFAKGIEFRPESIDSKPILMPDNQCLTRKETF